MSATVQSADDVLASCSFCGKPDTEVQRIVAGPGVYICNECVELSPAIVKSTALGTPEESSRRRSDSKNRSTGDMLGMLPSLVRAADRVERELAVSVRGLREHGAAWQAIAGAAGMSVDAARRRFESVPPD